jgi:hypothetical protein
VACGQTAVPSAGNTVVLVQHQHAALAATYSLLLTLENLQQQASCMQLGSTMKGRHRDINTSVVYALIIAEHTAAHHAWRRKNLVHHLKHAASEAVFNEARPWPVAGVKLLPAPCMLGSLPR